MNPVKFLQEVSKKMGGIPEFVFHLDSDRRRQKVIDALNSVPHDGTYDVEIRKHSSDRTQAQNRLLWKWHSEWARHHGITKDRAHDIFKWTIVLPVLIRDDTAGAWRKYYEWAKTDAEAAKLMVDNVHTFLLTKAQFAEVLNEYDRWCANRECQLSHPDDLYWSVQMEGV